MNAKGFNKDDVVYWNDPDGGVCSAPCVVVGTPSGYGENIYIVRKCGNGDAEGEEFGVLGTELTPFRMPEAHKEIFIVHFFTEYADTNERYSFACAHKSRDEAVKAVNEEMARALDAAGISEDGCTTSENEIAAAWKRGDTDEGHDAILVYGDFVMYCNITPATV